MTRARLIHDTSEKNPDLYYATRFTSPDRFLFLEVRGKKYLFMTDLELDRAKRQAAVTKVYSLTPFIKKAVARRAKPTAADVIVEIFRHFHVRSIEAPSSASFVMVDDLRRRGIKVHAGGSPLYPQRLIKSAEEVRLITASQRAVFSAMRAAEETLRASRIRKGRLYHRGRVLTSDGLRTLINTHLLERGFIASETIVSCGRHAIDPHDQGSGPLKPHASIIVDIYPRSIKTMYYGDATRTFCKGRAPDALRKLYATVKEGQLLAIASVKAGVNGKSVHQSLLDLFSARGYRTGQIDGRMQGFFHSTGHGIGIELHEDPTRIGPMDYILKAGHVVSVEPGLYYKDIGGVRIEDLVHVTKDGCTVLSGYPKRLEIS